MSPRTLLRLSLVLLASCFLSACWSGYVYNDDESGPILVKPREPEPAPIRKPRKLVAPKVAELTVPQQNQRAVIAFRGMGFEAFRDDKGVTVYLPPSTHFSGSESRVNSAASAKIAQIAQEVNKPYLSKRLVEVSGHTDSFGSDSLNLELSKKRSIAATTELVSSNVSRTRLTSLWFGEQQLRAPDHNADGSVNLESRSLNRRVEFLILNPR